MTILRMADKNPLFAAKPTDSKDVAWGLTTADTCWKRGERGEALKWLRRAVESASEAEDDERALELAKVAADLTTQIGSMAPPPGSMAPPAAGAAMPNPVPGAPRVPVAPRVAPHPLTGPKPPLKPAVPAKAAAAKDPPKKADRKSITNETGRNKGLGADATPNDKTNTDLTPVHGTPRRKSHSRADKAEAARKSRTDEIDAWPTDVLSGDEVPASLGLDAMAAAAKSAAAAAPPDVRAMQAVRVLVWRDTDGSVRVTAETGQTRAASLADAIEATVTALEPGADLVGLFKRPG